MYLTVNRGPMIVAAALLALAGPGATPAQAQERQLCVAQACLGMNLAETASLTLVPAGMLAFKLDDHHGQSYGLDGAGQRVSFADQGDMDGDVIRQFAARVKTICRFDSASARLKVGDDRHVLLFNPVIRNGKGELVLTEIARLLPKKMSDEQVRQAVAQVKQQYGDAYTEQWAKTVTRPNVALYDEMIMARSIVLRIPTANVADALIAQPGCAEKSGK